MTAKRNNGESRRYIFREGVWFFYQHLLVLTDHRKVRDEYEINVAITNLDQTTISRSKAMKRKVNCFNELNSLLVCLLTVAGRCYAIYEI